MRISLLYFSSTGNTRLLADHARDWLERHGAAATVHEVIKSQPADVLDCELLIVLYPVWGSDMPEPLQVFFEGVERASTDHITRPAVALVGNCGIFTGDTGVYWKARLERRGWEVVYADHALMPVNINVPNFNLWKVPRAAERAEIVRRGGRKLERILAGLLAGERRYAGRGPLDRLGGWLQRTFYEPSLQVWKDDLAVATARCTRCGLCARMCPTANITLDDDGVSFGGECIFCLKCFNLCPVGAVLVGARSRDREQYRRYKGPMGKPRPELYR